MQIPKFLEFETGNIIADNVLPAEADNAGESRRSFMEVLFRLGGKGDSVQELIDKKSRGHANKGRLIFRNKPEFIFMQLTTRLGADAAGSRQIFEKISLDYSVYFNAERYDWVGITVHHGVTVDGVVIT